MCEARCRCRRHLLICCCCCDLRTQSGTFQEGDFSIGRAGLIIGGKQQQGRFGASAAVGCVLEERQTCNAACDAHSAPHCLVMSIKNGCVALGGTHHWKLCPVQDARCSGVARTRRPVWIGAARHGRGAHAHEVINTAIAASQVLIRLPRSNNCMHEGWPPGAAC